jgi:hypothetical protein
LQDLITGSFHYVDKNKTSLGIAAQIAFANPEFYDLSNDLFVDGIVASGVIKETPKTGF